MIGIAKSFFFGSKAATAGTAITQIVPGKNNRVAKVVFLRYTSGATAHTVYFMTPQNKVLLSAAAAAGQAVVTLASDPGVFTGKRTANNVIATADWVAFKYPDGTLLAVLVHASTAPVVNADGTVTLTLAANLPTGGGLGIGATCYYFGLPTDTDPNTGEPFQSIITTVSATTDYGSFAGKTSIGQALNADDPILVYSSNVTNAGIMNMVSGIYGP